MAIEPLPGKQDYELVDTFALVRTGRYPSLEWKVISIKVHRTGPYEVLAVEDRDGDEVSEVIAAPILLPEAVDASIGAGALLRDPDTLDVIATVLAGPLDPPEESVENAVYLELDTELAVGTQFILEPVNEFGEFIAFPTVPRIERTFTVSADNPAGVGLLQELLFTIGLEYVHSVLQYLDVEVSPEDVAAAVSGAAIDGDNVQGVIVRKLEELVLAHEEEGVSGLTVR